VGLNETETECVCVCVCVCSLDTNRTVILQLDVILKNLPLSKRDAIVMLLLLCFFIAHFTSVFSCILFVVCVSFVLPVRVLVLKVFVKRELYFFFQINGITKEVICVLHRFYISDYITNNRTQVKTFIYNTS